MASCGQLFWPLVLIDHFVLLAERALNVDYNNVVLLSKKHGVAANSRLAVISRLGRQEMDDGLDYLAKSDIGQQ